MVVRQRRPFWTLLASLTTIAFVYLTLINITIDQNFHETKKLGKSVKTIVAYSLLKQIEIESELYICDGQLNSSDLNNYSAVNASVDADNNNDPAGDQNDEDNSWTKIDGTDLHVFSVHVDRRLGSYHYLRVIGMVKGAITAVTSIVFKEDNPTYLFEGDAENNYSTDNMPRLALHYIGVSIGVATSFIETKYQRLTGNITDPIYCQFSSIKRLYVTKVITTAIWLDIWDQNDTNVYFNPVLLSCRIPLGLTPKSIYLATKPCDKSQGKQFLIPNNAVQRQYTFTVCVKPLDFVEDISDRLIQWIEINRILGAEKIEIYVKKVKENVWRILKWYSSTYPDQIVVRKFKTITDEKVAVSKDQNFSRILWQKRRYEVVAYNHCFNKNMDVSYFVIPLDIDEVIVPNNTFTWKNILQDIFISSPEVKDKFASFMVSNAYFFAERPNKDQKKIFFLENVHRSQFSPPGESGKSFVSTKNSLTIFNHYALDVLRPGVSRTFFLPSSVVQLNHYKETCNTVILPECVKYISSPRVNDFTVLKYEKIFMDKYIKRILMLHKLGIL